MRILTLATLVFSFVVNGIAQNGTTEWNLDFELGDGLEAPRHYLQWGKGDHILSRDTTHVVSGEYSGRIQKKSSEGFGSLAFPFEAPDGRGNIVMTGWIKAEDVKGTAGLLLRVDGKNGYLAFDNMSDRGIDGTFDWKQFTITLEYPDKAKRIFAGCILSGSGDVWFDDLNITIGGIDVKDLPPRTVEPALADEDKEFDNGSGIQFDNITRIQREGMHDLCKVWGFVKYRHAAIAAGDIKWDYELFRVMPDVLSASSKAAQEEALATWLDQFPVRAPESPGQANDGEVKLKSHTKWIKSFDNQDLQNYLTQLQNTPTADEHYHIDFVRGVGNPIFQNEEPMAEMAFSDAGMRMLALFRYWNMIEYFFPYKYLMDQEWHSVLDDFLGKLAAADEEASYKLTLLELIGKVQDTHANIWQRHTVFTEKWGNRIIPVRVKYIEGQFVVTQTTPEMEDHFDVGDVILSIDGREMESLATDLKPYSPASNAPTQYRNICRRIMRTNAKSVEVQYDRAGTQHEVEVHTADVGSVDLSTKKEVSHKLLENNIGYIYPGSLETSQIHDIMEEFASTDGLIVDLRCYPSDFIVFTLGSYLMPYPTQFVKFTRGSLHSPGEFRFTQPLSTGGENDNYYKKPIIIIINEVTQSQAEYTTMALRVAPEALVIGSTTAGADGNISRIVLPGNISTVISGIGVYYPNGEETQRIGIVPDLEVHPTIAGTREGRDELLEKALSLIK